MNKKTIEGVKIFNKKVIVDDRGKILHMLRNDDKNFIRFGEIYFSYVYPKKVKAWHIHKKMTLNYCSAYGKIRLVLFDDREQSKTKGEVQELLYQMKIIFQYLSHQWFGMDLLEDGQTAVLANCSDIPHDKEEILRLPYDDPKFPYKWS